MLQSIETTLVEQTAHSTIETCIWGNKAAVIKTCRDPAEPRTRIRWDNEVQAMKLAGAHDNIASLLDSDSATLTLTLRLEPGKSLDRYADASRRCTLSHPEGEIVLRQMAVGLSHLHARRLVHDDVKPENIMWDPVGRRAVLIDFGAALNLADLPRGYFNPSGTPSYVPPEFLDRRKGIKGDVWALGIVMLYVWGQVRLPDGEWFLPGVWNDGGGVEIREWLQEVGNLAKIERDQGTVLGQMLQEDPQERIDSVELARKLSQYRQ